MARTHLAATFDQFFTPEQREALGRVRRALIEDQERELSRLSAKWTAADLRATSGGGAEGPIAEAISEA